MTRRSVLFNFSRRIDQIKPESDIWEIIYSKLSTVRSYEEPGLLSLAARSYSLVLVSTSEVELGGLRGTSQSGVKYRTKRFSVRVELGLD